MTETIESLTPEQEVWMIKIAGMLADLPDEQYVELIPVFELLLIGAKNIQKGLNSGDV